MSVASKCWDCGNAICGCDWSREGIPVKGWEATPTMLKGNLPSYFVISCPEFTPDREYIEEKKPQKPRQRHINRMQIILDCESGLSVVSVAEQHGVHKSTVYLILKQAGYKWNGESWVRKAG